MDQTLLVVADLAAISVLTFAVYFPRHHRRDLIAAFLGVTAVVSLMLITVVTVIFRASGIAFPGTYSLSELLLIPAVACALAYAGMQGEHTRVNLFVGRIKSVRLQRAIHGAMTLLGSLFWIAIAWASVREAIRRAPQHEVSPIINVPVSPFRWAMAAGIVLFVIVLLFQALKLFRGEPIEDEVQAKDYTK